jgi:hypothetical protein
MSDFGFQMKGKEGSLAVAACAATAGYWD